MKKTAANAVSIANKELGYLEKKSNKNLNSKTGNAGKNNYTKYSQVFGVNGCYWCAYFICWVFYTLCGNSKDEAKKVIYSLSGACETIRQAFIKKDRYFTKNPKVGDLIFFKGTRHAGANHIGIVEKVTSTKVYTIEGNTSVSGGVVDNGGGVARKSYSLSYSKILGYGRPNYEKDDNKTDTKPKTPTAVSYYKKYTGTAVNLDKILESIGVPAKYIGSASKRKPLAEKNGISNYKGTEAQNLKLIKLAKAGTLKKV